MVRGSSYTSSELHGSAIIRAHKNHGKTAKGPFSTRRNFPRGMIFYFVF